ncbi:MULTISPECIES: metal-sensitive transcriptional regulator [Paenibacillus]|jgi:DNA-binding FrmR family transcriptional regulator|uniref:Metal-sensing transcriptional repressor n=2 Tax=Paenibacillus TaxID=44249 RepID=A0A6L8VA40_9BACL|nr:MULTISPECIES: metal-sensitive transcriptional regulator [Paenibacillus]MBA2941528.1 metal-sensitive transcriptional regulator [Paenibacillus sp. CGMCC 1.16610]MVQ40343.1 metal-sensing transcriptional repressor [Paenibacillus anseongense]MZQ87188.1 metal-sensing transcriptional repressor [Paenibacillus silvestris]
MEYDKALKNRLKRMEGQIRGILGMMEAGEDCREVVTQLSAVRTAVDRTIGVVIGSNLQHCIQEELAKGNSPDKVIQEAVELLVKSR